MTPPKFLQTSPEAAGEAASAGHPEEQRALLSEDVLDETAILPADLGTSGYDVVPATSVAKLPNPKKPSRSD